MNDLLGNVKTRGVGTYSGPDIEEGFQPPPTESEESMQEFFQAVELIKKELADIKTLQRDITAMHERGKTIVKTKEMQKSREDMQTRINQVNLLARTVKGRLDALDKSNDAAKKAKGQGAGSANERTRTTVTAGLKKKLKDMMGEFSELRTRIQEEYREVVERRVFTVTGEHVSEEEIDRMIENGESEDIFKKAIQDVGRGRVLDTLAEIQERHRAVKDLEQSLLELHQIFLDMAVLVEAQGEMLDNIEKQVSRSVNYVKDGTQALQEAKNLQKNTRKWACIGLIILLVIALIVVLAVVRPWKYIRN